VKELLIAEGVYDSSSEGQTSVIAPIWGKTVFFGFIAENPAIMQKSLGYYIYPKKRGKRQVFKYAINNPPESTGIICRDSYDQFLGDATCGYAIYGAIA
jgi:hypothetical protein